MDYEQAWKELAVFVEEVSEEFPRQYESVHLILDLVREQMARLQKEIDAL